MPSPNRATLTRLLTTLTLSGLSLMGLSACGGEETPAESADPQGPIAGAPTGRGKADTTTRNPSDYIGKSWGNGVEGLLQFRGNPTHTWYGEGPVPEEAAVAWRYPESAMCGTSTVGGNPKTWCGTGWTGQPVVWERPDGITEAIFGAYDKSVHFVNADTGEATRPKFKTNDIIKGSVTLDPDAFPLLYFGSRDNKLRIVALDREIPTELWAYDAHEVPILWNNDWDGNPSIMGDVLYEGGENSWMHAWKLNRRYDEDGQVQISPEPLIQMRGWTDELIRQVGDRTMSIENSVAIFENRLYFANGGGRVVGLDLDVIEDGKAAIVFDYWAGDDIDASIVIDAEGMLYVSIEAERFLPRAEEVGQLIKLDPYATDDPLVWSVHTPTSSDGKGGLWATPALGTGVLYAPTHDGKLLVVSTETGEVLFEDRLGWHAWSSPALVDDRLIVANCSGQVRIYDASEPTTLTRLHTATLRSGACIESTPAVWKGRIMVGARDGYFYGFTNP